MEKKYYLNGLDCAHCAEKIRVAVENEDFVDRAEMNFTLKTLKVTYKKYNKNNENNVINTVVSIEPDVTVTYEKNDEKSGIDKTDIIISVIGIIVFVLSYLPVLSGINFWMQLIGCVAVSSKCIINVFKKLKNFDFFDENLLMLIACIGAFIIGERIEALGVMVFYKVGETAQDMAVAKSRRSITSLMNIKPDNARVIREGKEIIVPPEQVEIGEQIRILAGEKIPLDGIISGGATSLDTAALTGESVPMEKSVGDEVLSGGINVGGVITVIVQKHYRESTVARILELVENSSSQKAEPEKFITKFARIYTPCVVLAAFLLGVIGTLITRQPSVWIYRALTFLVVSCPCALVLSIPLSYFCAIGSAAKQGILIKGGNYVEHLNRIDAVVFDKTGTLTTGEFKVNKVYPENNFTDSDVLFYAAVAESCSNHPIAKSIVAANDRFIDASKVNNSHETVSGGVFAEYEGKTIIVGSNRFLNQNNINCKANGMIAVGINGELAGYIEITDKLKSGTDTLIYELSRLNISKTYMLTGDNERSAEAVSKAVGINNYYSSLLPDNKLEIMKKIQSNHKTVFVGDGINDAPVLISADIGIAMGGIGSDSAIEAADIVLMNDDVGKVPSVIKLAKRTHSIVVQNIIIALGIKLLVLILSAIGLAPMWIAVFADVGVALICVLNSMRLLKDKF